MKKKEINKKQEKCLQSLLSQNSLVEKIISKIKDNNGIALLVGGAVRDLLLNRKTKDLDIEVHGLSIEQLQTILELFGPVSLVGKSFGVLRLHNLDIDWSLPRADTAGRKPTVTIDPYMSYKDAFARRDLTINAMGINLHDYELIDPFDGQKDIKNKILRTPDANFFLQDPLRFFRVMQFIARFDMYPNQELQKICMDMDISTVSRERIEQEFHKMLLKSKRPSLGIRWLKDIGRLKEILLELYSCVGVKQNVDWHPEGDVFEHTMQTLDAAAIIAQSYNKEEKKLLLMYAVLCHDLGKPETTEKINGEYKSFGHEKVSAIKAKKCMKRITYNKNLIDGVIKLVEYHTQPMQFVQNKATLSAYKRLAQKLAPHATLSLLADLALADKRGRNPDNQIPLTDSFDDINQFIEHATQAQVLLDVEKPILKGSDIIDIVEPGPRMGQLLKYAYQIQLERGIKDKDILKQLIIEWMKDH